MTKGEIRREEARKLNVKYRRELWIAMYKRKFFSNNNSGELRRQQSIQVANESVVDFNDMFKQKKLVEEDSTNLEGGASADSPTIPTSHVAAH